GRGLLGKPTAVGQVITRALVNDPNFRVQLGSGGRTQVRLLDIRIGIDRTHSTGTHSTGISSNGREPVNRSPSSALLLGSRLFDGSAERRTGRSEFRRGSSAPRGTGAPPRKTSDPGFRDRTEPRRSTRFPLINTGGRRLRVTQPMMPP